MDGISMPAARALDELQRLAESVKGQGMADGLRTLSKMHEMCVVLAAKSADAAEAGDEDAALAVMGRVAEIFVKFI